MWKIWPSSVCFNSSKNWPSPQPCTDCACMLSFSFPGCGCMLVFSSSQNYDLTRNLTKICHEWQCGNMTKLELFNWDEKIEQCPQLCTNCACMLIFSYPGCGCMLIFSSSQKYGTKWNLAKMWHEWDKWSFFEHFPQLCRDFGGMHIFSFQIVAACLLLVFLQKYGTKYENIAQICLTPKHSHTSGVIKLDGRASPKVCSLPLIRWYVDFQKSSAFSFWQCTKNLRYFWKSMPCFRFCKKFDHFLSCTKNQNAQDDVLCTVNCPWSMMKNKHKKNPETKRQHTETAPKRVTWFRENDPYKSRWQRVAMAPFQ